VPGTTSAYAERLTGGFYLDIEPDLTQLARYGLSVGANCRTSSHAALGGEMVTTTVEGRERFGVIVRYPRELRDSPERIAREVLVPTMGGAHGAARRGGERFERQGAPSIRTENALLSAYIYVDIREPRHRRLRAEARKASDKVKFPAGYYITWSGQFEYMQRAIATMKVVMPLTLLIIFLLLYLNFRRVTESLIVMLSVPFALVGGVWLMWALGYNLRSPWPSASSRWRGGGANRRGDADLPRPRLGSARKSAAARKTPASRRQRPLMARSWKAPSSACGRR
jgi:Cu(I)/Ag(I) efflux system membrane protein CusA/SilA